MMNKMTCTFLLGCLGALGAACSVETGKDAAPEEDYASAGTLELPLVAVEGDHIYRVTGIQVAVYGPTYAYLNGSDDPTETVISTSLPTGDYTAYFYGGRLERDDGTGNFAPVEARLVSSSIRSFKVFNGTTTTLEFEFETDGVIVTVGGGEVRVILDVTEGAAVCTPFSDECGSGAWCPPTGLTGLARACVFEGPVARGESCVGPSECVANSSCFDLGSGPVCAELCPIVDVGSPCASGGTCEGVDAEYGVCVP